MFDKFNIKKKVRPKIADVQCTRLKFEPGDRILVRTYVQLSREQIKKLRRSIEKWAGVAVEVLIINATEIDLEIIKGAKGAGEETPSRILRK